MVHVDSMRRTSCSVAAAWQAKRAVPALLCQGLDLESGKLEECALAARRTPSNTFLTTSISRWKAAANAVVCRARLWRMPLLWDMDWKACPHISVASGAAVRLDW